MKYFFLTIVCSFFLMHGKAQEERKFIREGNTQFEGEKYVESEIAYRKALSKDNQSFEGQFNLGDALFKQKKYEEALEQFQALAGSEKDPEKLAQVYHNIGNSYFAMQQFDKSVDAYKNALRNNHTDHESRYNLIAAQKMLKNQQENKQDQQQQQQDQQQQQQEQQQQQQQQDQQQDQQQNQDQQQQQNPDEMTKEEADRYLNALQQDENELQKKLQKLRAGEKTKTEKNW